MNCNLIQDLIPLYIDGCCSDESKNAVEEHIKSCPDCKSIIDDMCNDTQTVKTKSAPKKMTRISEWKASLLQSVLLFVSFALITIGVALEAKTPLGLLNGYWAFNLVIPSTAFMLSLSNWYFVRVYKSKKIFSVTSLCATLLISIIAFNWGNMHYGIGNFFDIAVLRFNGIGIMLATVFCVLSFVLSRAYAAMLGKE